MQSLFEQSLLLQNRVKRLLINDNSKTHCRCGRVSPKRRGRVLLLYTPRRDWEFPGGQVEEGEDLMTALQREVREETGLTVTVGKLAGVYSNVKSHIVMFDFLCELVSGDLQTSAESLAVEWVAAEDALNMLEFNGEVVYRAYEFDADKVYTEYVVHREQTL